MKQNRPTSPARAAASRSNGAKSGGSVSASGTFRSSRNALLHSAYAPIHTLTNASTRLFNIRQLGPDETNNAGASRQIIENTHADVSGSRKPEANLRECRVRSQLTSPPRFDPSGSPQRYFRYSSREAIENTGPIAQVTAAPEPASRM